MQLQSTLKNLIFISIYIVMYKLVVFIKEKSRVYYLILYVRKYQHLIIFTYKISRKIIKSFKIISEYKMIQKIAHHE